MHLLWGLWWGFLGGGAGVFLIILLLKIALEHIFLLAYLAYTALIMSCHRAQPNEKINCLYDSQGTLDN